jgi:hypothetical protein
VCCVSFLVSSCMFDANDAKEEEIVFVLAPTKLGVPRSWSVLLSRLSPVVVFDNHPKREV